MRGAGTPESYMHFYAKKTLASWIRGRITIGKNFKGLYPVATYIPYTGLTLVYEEYPIASSIAQSDIGLRRSCPEGGAKDCSCQTGWNCVKLKGIKCIIPTARELQLSKTLKTKYIFDVAVLNTTGELSCVFEICHRNPITRSKIDWLRLHNIPWFELSAEWILRQNCSPYSIVDGIIRAHKN
jgi:hypothetical protein